VQARCVTELRLAGVGMMMAATVGAMLRLEGRLDVFDLGAQLQEHVLEYIVVE